MKERACKVLTVALLLLIAGGGYALFYRRTGVGIPCPVRMLTGLKCPGCGVTRMCDSLLRGDFTAAWEHHAALLCLLPVLLFLLIRYLYFYIRDGHAQDSLTVRILRYFSLAVLLIFCVVRNITEHHFWNLFERIRTFF